VRRLTVVAILALAAAVAAALVIAQTRSAGETAQTRSAGEADTPTLEELKTGVGRVEILNCDGTPLSFGGHDVAGSGFLIGSRVVMSAEHGMWIGQDQPACKMRVRFGDKAYPVTSVRVWGDPGQEDMYARRGVDVATLTVAKPVDGYLFRFAAEGAPVGTRVATLGYPLGGPLAVTRGEVTNNVIDYEVPSVAAKIDIEGGNSGGPIFSDEGEVISVVSRIVISGSLTADRSNRWGGVDIPRWWGADALADLCKTYPEGELPDCDDESGSDTQKASAVLLPRDR
jgi:serine protease Do